MVVLLVGLGTASILTTTLLKSYLIKQVDGDLSTTYSTIAGQIINDKSQESDLLPSDYYLALRQTNGAVRAWVQSDTSAERGIPDLSQFLSSVDGQFTQAPQDAFTTDAVSHCR